MEVEEVRWELRTEQICSQQERQLVPSLRVARRLHWLHTEARSPRPSFLNQLLRRLSNNLRQLAVALAVLALQKEPWLQISEDSVACLRAQTPIPFS